MIAKVLTSAVANANEAEADVDRLVVADARVDSGPTIKRFREKDRGRAHRILKRTSHLVVVVEEA
jgi:large subunit ribosomal protein L22